MDLWLLISRWRRAAALALGFLICVSAGAAAQGEVRPVAVPGKSSVLMGLPPERADRVKALMIRIKVANGQLDERIQKYREALEELYRAYRFDEQRCHRLHQLIRQTQDELLKLHHSFQLQLRGLLTPAEFEMLQREFQQAREDKRTREQDKLKLFRSQQEPVPRSRD